jgi:hypothetical protein
VKTARRLSGIVSILCLTLGFAACSSSSEGPKADGGITCQQGGKSYKPGQVVVVSSCSTCVCLADGKVGNCTGACSDAGGGPDATADAGKKLDGAADAPAETDLPNRPDVAPDADAGNADVAPKPDAVIYADSSNVDSVTDLDSRAVDAVTNLDSPKVPDASIIDVGPNPDTAITCSYGGKSYAIGDVAMVSACTSCICQSNGTLGLCTGVCMDGGASIPDGGLSELCMSTGGYIITQACCATTGDFPNTCDIGACSCGLTGHTVEVCVCADGCFVPDRGCVY